MKSSIGKVVQYVIAVSFFLIVTVLGYCLFNTKVEFTKIDTDSKVYRLNIRDINNPKIPIPIPDPVNGHEPIIVSYNLPTITKSNTAIMYKSLYSATRVYVDGEFLGSYGTKEQLPFGNMIGNIRVLFPITQDMSGKELSIVVSPIYNMGIDYALVSLGTSDDLKLKIIHENLWRIILSVFFLVVAIMCFGLCIYQLSTKTIHNSAAAYLYLGWFVTTVFIWTICSSDIPQFFANRNGYVSLVSYMALAIMGVPFMGYCSETFSNYKRYFQNIELIGSLGPIVTIVLFITGIADPPDTVFLTHVYIFIVLIASIVFSAKEWKNNNESHLFIVGLLILIVSAMLGLGWYYLRPELGYDALFFGVGFLIFVLVLFSIMLVREAKFIRERMSMDIYKEMAFIDKLTGCGNRAALETEIKEGHFYGDSPYITFGILDLNYLKQINDNFGHGEGDRVIMAAANCMNNALNSAGKAFRLGGDEFAVVFWNEPHKIETFCEALDNEVTLYNTQHEIKVSLAKGFVERKWEEGDKFFNRLYHDADEKMYEDKMKYHSRRMG